jgi:hypothetical protein
VVLVDDVVEPDEQAAAASVRETMSTIKEPPYRSRRFIPDSFVVSGTYPGP